MPQNAYFECGTCGKEFPAGWQARDSHCNATGHEKPEYECDTCHRWFQTQAACDQHMRAKNHWSFQCQFCDETWPTGECCTEHEIEEHYWCGECDRKFQSLNGIRMHLNSRAHRGEDVSCPYCDRAFVSATGLVHHLERNSCPNSPELGLTKVYRIVQSKDPDSLITKYIQDWYGINEYVDGGRAWNGYRYECFFCDRVFQTPGSLRRHLNLPAHNLLLYRCPAHYCGREFGTFAAVINHMESETCGYIEFEDVQQHIVDIFINDHYNIRFNQGGVIRGQKKRGEPPA